MRGRLTRERRWGSATALAMLCGVCLLALAVGAIAAAASRHGQNHRLASHVCGLDDRGPIWPVSVRTGAKKVLVPRGATSLTVCRYNGMNAVGDAPQFALRGVGVTADHATIARLVDELDALKPARGAYNCPMDDDSQDVASFGYASGPSVVVTVGTNGCNNVTNGHVRRLGLGKPVVAQLSALAQPINTFKWATVAGRVRLCGGPAPGRCWFQKEAYPYASRAVAVNSSGLWVAMAQLSHNRFRFTIAAPGSYRFELMGSGQHLNTVIARTKASVQAGAITNVVFTIPVP